MESISVAYGSWVSPISADLVARANLRLSEVECDGDRVYWLEMRSAEAGRSVVVCRDPDGSIRDLVPREFDARTRVHEYGGGSFLVCGPGGELLFSNFQDQRVYRCGVEPGRGQSPRPVTPGNGLRYADGIHDPYRGRWVGVREDHTGGAQPVNAIVGLDPTADGDGEAGTVLVAGNDFYAAPRLSPDGDQLAYLTWDHPHMPWEAAELWVAEVNRDGSLGGSRRVAGGRKRSVVQPQWSPGGILYFVWEEGNWWNLFRLTQGTAECVREHPAEFAGPHWGFRQKWFDFTCEEEILCAYSQDGKSHLARVDVKSGRLTPVEIPFDSITHVSVAAGAVAYLVAEAATDFGGIVRLDLGTGEHSIIRRSSDVGIDRAYLSAPQPIEYPTEGGRTAHALFYAPRNPRYQARPGDKPPLLLMTHGGPTSATSPALRLGVQYYTSRGIAVADVNYGGSTGYGREYRERLRHSWGVVDVDDCCNAARYLAERGLVDPTRLAITGGSAGGYTTLACLAFRDVFAAGSSRYGVSDLGALAEETHKFESHYLDSLVAAYPEGRDLYRRRSPLHHPDGFRCPVIFFQGLEDRVVPPNQSEVMVAALRDRGIPVAYVAFEGEQHGFRKSQNIERALEAELYFLGKILGFDPADRIPAVEIWNL